MFSNSCREDFDRVDGDMVREGVSGCVKKISKRMRRFFNETEARPQTVTLLESRTTESKPHLF